MRKIILTLAIFLLYNSNLYSFNGINRKYSFPGIGEFYSFLFRAEGRKLGVDPRILASICYVESKWNPRALNKVDGKTSSYGLCQIKLETARSVGFKGSSKDLFKASVNIHFAGLYYKAKLLKYRGNEFCAIAAYNAGACRYAFSGKILNNKYVKKVTKSFEKMLDVF